MVSLSALYRHLKYQSFRAQLCSMERTSAHWSVLDYNTMSFVKATGFDTSLPAVLLLQICLSNLSRFFAGATQLQHFRFQSRASLLLDHTLATVIKQLRSLKVDWLDTEEDFGAIPFKVIQAYLTRMPRALMQFQFSVKRQLQSKWGKYLG